jgi:hypothetical protein
VEKVGVMKNVKMLCDSSGIGSGIDAELLVHYFKNVALSCHGLQIITTLGLVFNSCLHV